MRTVLKKSAEVLIAAAAWTGLAAMVLHVIRGRAGLDALRQAADILFYFTIQSSLFAALIFTARAAGSKNRIVNSAAVSGAVTLYTGVTGVFFAFLLQKTVSISHPLFQTGNILLHYAVPALAFLYWIIFPDSERCRRRDPLLWLFYPLFYFVLTVVRGLLAARYPYYFIDPGRLGYPQALMNAAIILAVIGLLGYLLFAMDRLKRRLLRG